MTVSSSTNKVSYSGNGASTIFAYTFKIFDEDDLTVILRASDGTETVQTITTDYTVSGVEDDGGGNVTFVTAPASGVTVVIIREQPLTQGLDLVANDPFSAENLEASLDKLTFMVQQHEEELGRVIKASKTNTITGSEFTISAADRANKVFAFDSDGDLSITKELGTYRGDWAASTAYNQRDIVKDTSDGSIYIVNEAHTSSGSQPLDTNTNSSKYDVLFDVGGLLTDTVTLSGDLTVNGNTTLGSGINDTITVSTDITPDTHNTHSLGENLKRFLDLYLQGNLFTPNATIATLLQVNGNTNLGNVNSDTLTVNARVDSNIVPQTDDTYDLGENSRRWRGTHTENVYAVNVFLDGPTLDSFKTKLVAIEPTASNTISFPNTSGTVVLQQDFTSWSDVNAIDQGLATTDTVTFANVETSGYLRGPALFTIDPATHGDNTGTVVIDGNLQVDGNTTTVNSTQLEVDDLNITVASGAANAAAADGAGLTIDGANITLAYSHTDSVFDINYDFRVSGDLSTLNSGGYINLFEASDSSGVFTKFVDASTGKTTTDGFLIGLDSDQKAIFRNYEQTDMEFATDGVTHMRVGAAGNVLLESGNGLRFLGASDSLYTQITRTNPSGTNTAKLQDKSGTIALEDNDGNLFLNDDTALISPQTGSTSSTTQTTIATFQHALWNAAKATITANDGTDTHITEMLIAHDGTTAVATEYGMVHTSASPLATYDVQIGGSQLNVLATAAATTATSYTIVLTLTQGQ